MEKDEELSTMKRREEKNGLKVRKGVNEEGLMRRKREEKIKG